MYCRFCKSEQTFTFTEDNIKFIQCCSCGNKERLKNYFAHRSLKEGLTPICQK